MPERLDVLDIHIDLFGVIATQDAGEGWDGEVSAETHRSAAACPARQVSAKLAVSSSRRAGYRRSRHNARILDGTRVKPDVTVVTRTCQSVPDCMS
ncbi:MAG TPA: hypothetical protein VLM11_23155 [Streptosporangiaceae bacterium]|nr:hypothetical protein [Streptosporangiaceae bacterium]